jgi:ABC-2 type transport system permease protein
MNLALWKKAYGEVRVSLPCLVLLMFGFQFVFVRLISQVDLQYIQFLLQHLPEDWKRLLPGPVDNIWTYAGRVAIGYEHPVAVFGMAYWAIARGSDAVSGPLGRGTLEIVLAQPVRRVSVLASNAAMTTLGSALMATACWLGTFAGLSTVSEMHELPTLPYVGCAVNLFAYTFFLAAVTALLSSWDRYRGRTIGLAVAFYIGSMVLNVIGRMSDRFHDLQYASFITAFEPQLFVNPQANAAMLALRYDLPLLSAGIVCYVAAAAVLARRDLPAPL